MSTEIRVMICDDSAIMRRLVKTALELESTLEVVCEAIHGRDAVERLADAQPDVVVMDIEMPIMDGVEAVREIRKRDPHLPVIMFSSLTSRGAEASLDALAAGATDFATKPTGAGHIQKALDSLRRDLIPKLLQWTTRKRASASVNEGGGPSGTTASQSGRQPTHAAATGKVPDHSIAAIGVAVSTGGPQALAKFLSDLPRDFPVPILIAQQMPPVFTGSLAKRLSDITGHRVREASNGDDLDPATILIAPGDHHMTVERNHDGVMVRLNQDPPENGCRPSANPLLGSLGDCFGPQALGIVMTGMGQDGTRGAKHLQSRGGKVMVQDQASSIVWGMPGSVVNSGHADQIVSLDQLASEVLRVARAEAGVAISS